MKKLLSAMLIVFILGCTLVCLVACKKDEGDYVDYGKDNNYEYERTEDKNAVTYTPIGATAKYGLVFYIGTAIAPEHYSYLAEPLAKQGYIVVIPKVALAYMMYKETESAFTNYPDIEFFVGGHSQGGGAALRRAQENADSVKGVILYAPLCFNKDSLKNSSMPTLLLEASSDGVLTAEMKSDAKTRLPDTRTELMLEGCHMSFSSYDSNATLTMFNDGPVSDEVKTAQKEQTYGHTLAFMRSVIQG